MFARISTLLFTLLFALMAIASPIVERTGSTVNQCNTGSISCCNSVQDSNSTAVTGLLGLLGVSLEGIVGQVGLSCSPLSVIGVGGASSCNAEPVCCTNNQFNGLINLGCSPINLNL
ncbi:hypothetical protein SERLA73DRAFT_134819 [Serpula lacrymans var. lacrymans S7.3]|uniref:Hydrophobin n=2 Tax=Serpula lacrymans var. lacrymans TaxID=341189 RepID=F8PVV1_SERL3|nr:hydrophobin [Serpula lacrymans var. lacrymans S7.9]EGN99547.1 hypothetical protein SERLA73DRAFT_134819 [Serpula lacrymans var. lacrymans S7.3]EGO25118.1 hydrophobin [Serpula lacrymans var. lacrymans S7.9]